MGRERILVVEDDAVVAMSLELTLGWLGYEVAGVVHSGEDAVQAAETTGADLALMDIRLSGAMDGVEAADEISRRFRVPVVYLTAYSDEETLRRAGATSPFGYIVKPYNDRDLKTAIEVALQRAREERRLREEGDEYRSLFEEDVQGRFVTAPDGTILSCNRAFLELFGFDSRAEAEASNARELYASPQDRERIVEELRRGNQVESVPVELVRRDGAPLRGLLSAAGQRDGEGNLVSIRGRIVEASTEQQPAPGLVGLRGEAPSREEFLEILAGVSARAARLESREHLDEAQREEIREIRQAADRAVALTRSLLRQPGGHALGPRVTDLNGAVRQIARMLEEAVDERVRVRVDLTEQPALIEGHPAQIERVILNLAIHAWDAMPEGGEIEMRTFEAALSTPVQENDVEIPAGRYVVLEVSHTGTDREAELRRQLFEPFLSRERLSHGLGLSTVYGVIKQSGGFPSVIPDQDRVVFRAHFPRADRP